MIDGNAVGGIIGYGKTFIIEDENGNEVVGVVTDSVVVFDATDNDVREGITYASDGGISVGTKIIPSYYTTEGMRVIAAGKKFTIEKIGDRCDFTKLQALICSNSVSTEKVCINTKVYAVNSTSVLSNVVVDINNEIIDLGITNEEDSSYVIRYFTYKEEY